MNATLARTRLLVLDVDGVLTDGRVTYGDQNLQLQSFDVKDGLGLSMLRKAGITVAWITGRGCAATERRASELGVAELHMGSRGTKLELLRDMQTRLGVSADQTVAVGDDLFDLPMAKAAALFACPSDAHEGVLERADLVLSRPGGCGAVRELCDLILRSQGKWDQMLAELSN